MLIDTHAHIHFEEFRPELDDVLTRAHEAGVGKIMTVGCNDTDSAQAVAVARAYDNVWATVGLHPHDADRGYEALEEVARLAEFEKVVAIGECGLDNFRSETSAEDQERALRFQIELGLERGLPMVFHVRDAFPEFFAILDEYEGVRGLVHCFTAGTKELEGSLARGLSIALNGIMTFTKDEHQLEAARRVPLDRLVLETDCPFLAPVPLRGKRNEPANIAHTAAFLAKLRGEALEDLEATTSRNAERLFGI
ncbi:MAG TPA: TatD family hydrolase [Candidatus Saccharimonadia bacterium]|jgi:TatD DNase family protein|nr:TatD family hydrolase [Candidatus Saccharimonadia bacterium]